MKKTREFRGRGKGRVPDSPAKGKSNNNIPPDRYARKKKGSPVGPEMSASELNAEYDKHRLESRPNRYAKTKKARVDGLIESLLKEFWMSGFREIEKIVVPKGLYELFPSPEKMTAVFHSGLQPFIPLEEGDVFEIRFRSPQ